MSSIGQAFQNGKAFIPLITCGDPDPEGIKRSVRTVVATSADLVEFGIPLSDPATEGSAIQAANLRALSGGVTTDTVFRTVAEFHEELTMPLIFMIYADIVFSYDIARFTACTTGVGIDDIILPDAPFEEKEEFASISRTVGIDSIPMITPTSMACIRGIAAAAEGFLYVVSLLGVTGVQQGINTDLSGMFASVWQTSLSLPAAIGLSISTPAQAKRMVAIADGMIVGSAIVRIMAEEGCKADKEIVHYMREMKTAASTL